MPAASILIKPASANCNMDCSYCFYKTLSSHRAEYSKGFMSEETLDALIRNGLAYGNEYAAFAFQGGEPTLCGPDFFRTVVRLQKKYRRPGQVIENSIQTNGLLIDDAWARFLAEEDFLTGISLDGPKKIHDACRRDTSGSATFGKIMQTLSLLKKYGVRYNILSVISEANVDKASYLYDFYKRNRFHFIQLIPCMDERGRESGAYALDPMRYGRFLCEIFDLWYADFMNGADMDIRMFSNLAQMAAGYPAEECGMNGHCTCYFVVEGDGSVYPCDFYCMDAWRLGSVQDSFAELITSDKAAAFLREGAEPAENCPSCPWYALCRGGCRRWRETGTVGQYGISRLCPAYQMFFEHTRDRLQILGRMILMRYGPCRRDAAECTAQNVQHRKHRMYSTESTECTAQKAQNV